MKAFWAYLNEISQLVEKQHSNYNKPLNWFHPYKSVHLEDQKNEIIKRIENKLQWSFKNTKPWVNSLSPGCRICGEGEWSCLFVTGKCNANCFYCPASQANDETPQTQKLLFETPRTYVDYINRFQFKGVSFSGGEPLLVFDRTLDFIRNVRQKCDPDIYIWMYTNGILASDEKFRLLADAGLNEIRFDLGAVNYNPKVLKNASQFIENVTVEIPAVPEDKDMLFAVLPRLCEYGVTNLNLHQLRLTTYNSANLLKNNYTYLHGEQPTVIESEITALEVIDFVIENNLSIGVNYCNFQFKNRFQKAGFRIKMAQELKTEGEEITENGYLRRIEIASDDGFKPILLAELTKSRQNYDRIKISYSGRVLENLNPKSSNRNYQIGSKKYPVTEGLVTEPIILEGKLIDLYLEMISASGMTMPDNPQLFEAWRHEFIEDGLREYF
jgi:pyruvate formate-lyase activating enzyme-like uncharacterized protein